MIDRDVSLKLSRGSLLKSGVAIGTFFAAEGAATVAGCTPPPKSSIGALRFEFIVKTVNADYWQACLEGGKAASQQFGLQALQFTGADSETNIQRQIELVEDAIAKKPDFIVLAPTSSTALDLTIETVANAGIKLILVDSAANTDAYQTFLA